MPRSRTAALLAVGAASAVCAPLAQAAPTPVTSTRYLLTVDRKLETKLLDNCTLITSYGWVELDRIKNRQAFASGPVKAAGSYDLAARTGSVSTKPDAFHIEPLGWHTYEFRRAVRVSDIGFQVVKGKAFLTGRTRSAKGRSAGKSRLSRLASMPKPKFFAGPGHYNDGSDIPNSYLFAFQGKATVLPALAKAFEQTRCKRTKFRGQHAGRIRSGVALGELTVQMGVASAFGTAGTLSLSGEPWLETDENGDPVTATPTGGATRVVHGSDRSIRFALPAGIRVPLACTDGLGCVPSGGSFGVAGGFTLAFGGKSATVGDLSVSYAPTDLGTGISVNATLDGQPVTFAASPSGSFPSVTSDFSDRLGAAWGTPLRGGLVKVVPEFTATTQTP